MPTRVHRRLLHSAQKLKKNRKEGGARTALDTRECYANSDAERRRKKKSVLLFQLLSIALSFNSSGPSDCGDDHVLGSRMNERGECSIRLSLRTVCALHAMEQTRLSPNALRWSCGLLLLLLTEATTTDCRARPNHAKPSQAELSQ